MRSVQTVEKSKTDYKTPQISFGSSRRSDVSDYHCFHGNKSENYPSVSYVLCGEISFGRSLVGTIALGNLNFVENVKSELGFKAVRREVIEGGGTYAFREEK